MVELGLRLVVVIDDIRTDAADDQDRQLLPHIVPIGHSDDFNFDSRGLSEGRNSSFEQSGHRPTHDQLDLPGSQGRSDS